LRRQLIRFTPAMIGGTALLLAASQVDGSAQTLMWGLALLADYGGTFLGARRVGDCALPVSSRSGTA
jgi:hypothetical protein